MNVYFDADIVTKSKLSISISLPFMWGLLSWKKNNQPEYENN